MKVRLATADARVAPIAEFVIAVRLILAEKAMGSREIKSRLGAGAGLPGSSASGQDRVHAALQRLKKSGHAEQQTRGGWWRLSDAGKQWLAENAK